MAIEGGKELGDYEQMLARQMFDYTAKYNSPEEEMKRLKDAGLNPALMYNLGGGEGGTTAGGSVSGLDSGTAGTAEYQKAGSGTMPYSKLIDAQVENMQAQTEKTKAEADDIKGISKEVKKATIASILQGTENEKLKADGMKITQELERLKAEAQEIANKWSDEELQWNVKRLEQQYNEIRFNNQIQNEVREEIKQKFLLENKKIAMDILKGQSDIAVDEATIWKTYEDVFLGRGELAERRASRLQSKDENERDRAMKEVELRIKAENPQLGTVAGNVLQKSIMWLSQGLPLGIWKNFDNTIEIPTIK